MAASVVKDSVKMENSKRSFSLDENRLNCLKADIHSKGSLLSSTWNDLYRLLSQYQSELFVSDAPRGDTELRRDIVKKDAQLSELQHKLSLAETEIERVRLDLTVKNSLLQKYQDDLLDKEAALMTCQATIRKLENKHQLLENRMNVKTVNHEVIPHHDDEEDRKPPKGSLINASISAISQKRKLNSVNSSSKRKSRTPAQKSPANDLLQEVIDDVIENNHTGLDAETKQELKECLNSTPMNESVFPEPEEAPLPLEQYENWQNDALAQATGEVITSSKKSSRWEDPLRRHACPHCSKNFTRPKDVKRHVNTVHLKLKSYGCPSCDKRFTRKEHSVRHLARCLGNYGIPYDASLIETYQRTKPDDEYVRISGGFNQGGPEADRAENGYDSAKFSAETAIFPEMV